MAQLCLLCRQKGHTTADCPDGNKPRGTNKPGPNAVSYFPLNKNQQKPDALCTRCTDLRLLDLLLREDVQDEQAGSTANKNTQLYRSLGPYRSIKFIDTCPLCRLLFSIFPPEDALIEPGDDYLLKPMRTYNRLGGTLEGAKTAHQYEQYAVSVSVMAVEPLAWVDPRFVYEASIGIVGKPSLPSSGPSSGPPPSTPRAGLPIRVRDQLVDYKTIQSWLHNCDTQHPNCTAVWVDELLTTSMIDVHTLNIVPCPPNCKYMALSYVWGPIVPEKDALKKDTLPPSITDAMEATRQLGIRYLWVDALCIDQDPSSPSKMQQLSIMDRIYAGAYATLVAFYGESSLAGLRGSTPDRARANQPRESIIDVNGGGAAYELSVMYPTIKAERAKHTCTYCTRAWTFQEEILSQRLIYFGQDQVHYRCRIMAGQETVDETKDPAQILNPVITAEGETGDYLRQLSRNGLMASGTNNKSQAGGPTQAHISSKSVAHVVGCIEEYTSRQMAQDHDSLNACRGILSFVRRQEGLQEFVWGLPLRDFPLSLMWNHSAKYGMDNVKWKPPRRRAAFPSWSFVGWQGAATHMFLEDLIQTAAEETKHVHQDMARKEMTDNLCIQFVDIQDQTLTMAGWTVRLEIQTAPFSTAFVPGKPDDPIGILSQNDEVHPTTLPAGVFDFVIVQRQTRDTGNGRFNHVLYLLMLDDNGPGAVPSRRAFVRWNVERDFIPTPEYAAMLKRNDKIQMV